jgi:hypothetical protein
MRQPVTGRRRLARLVHRWRPDRNPLRRTADRIEAVILAAMLAAFLIGAPLAALAAGQWAAAAGLRTEHTQTAWHRVPAVLLQNAPDPPHALFQASTEPLVRARWSAPGGAPRTGEIYAPGGSTAGSTVQSWTDRSGRVTGTPIEGADVVVRIALAALLATAIVAAALALLGLVAHWILDRRRLAAWDAHWSATGPQWTGRR